MIRVAIVCGVIQAWRHSLWKRISDHLGMKVRFFHGRNIPGTKQINAPDLSDLDHIELPTLSGVIRSSGRPAPLKYHFGIIRALRSWSPDIIICEGGSNILTNAAVFPWANGHRVPIVWWGLGQLPNRTYRGLVARTYSMIRHRQERQSSSYLGYSTQAAEYFISQGYPEDRCYVALNCLDTDSIQAKIPQEREQVSRLRRKLHVTESNQIVLFCGTVIQPKRVDRLLRAMAQLIVKHPQAILVIVGDGPALPEAKTLAATLGIRNHVRFTGAVWEGTGSYFELADFFVLPGLGGLAICEAMTHGIPVISAPADGTEKDYIAHGKSGFLLRESDENAVIGELALYMDRLLTDPKMARDMGKASYDFATGEGSVRAYIDAFSLCIRETLRREIHWASNA